MMLASNLAYDTWLQGALRYKPEGSRPDEVIEFFFQLT
jgi:hypothetical protein